MKFQMRIVKKLNVHIVIIVFLSCSFVTDISIEGNDTVSDDIIMSLLEQEGFKTGKLVYNIDK